MLRFVLKRVFVGIICVWFIWSLVFVLVRLTGDPVTILLPDAPSETVVAELRAAMGLDLPLSKQYIKAFTSVFRGDMGTSYYYKRSVNELYAERLGATLSLGLPSFALAAVFGVILGVIAAVKHDTIYDRLTMSSAVIGYTIPNFALGIILILIFSLGLRILPSGGYGTLRHYILPVITMSVGPMATIARLTRGSMLDSLGKGYLDGARMKGLKEWVVIIKHALRTSLIPVVTTVGMQLGTIIGGVFVVETVFAWPGLGRLIIKAATQRDFPTVQYGILLVAIMVTLANILVDVSYGFLDPRIREGYK